MPQKFVRSERGVAMLLELVLVAAVLAVVGLAVYGANNRQKAAEGPRQPAVVMNAAADAAVTAAAREAASSAAAVDVESAELTAAETEIDQLGGEDARF